jgi:DNA-binding IclR family transcriptional regulator
MTIRTDEASADQRLGLMPKRRLQQSHAGRDRPKPKVLNSPSSAAIKSAERALGILEYFREERRAATVGEISNSLGLPQSSTSMLLKCLSNLGYLDYGPETRKFRPTYRVAVLGSWIQKSLFDGGPLTDTMEALRQETGESVMLGLQNGAKMQYVHIVEANNAVRLTIQVGILRPMTCSALGQMLLTRKADHEVRAIVRSNNADAVDAAHRVKEREFMAELETIRFRGFAESQGRMIAEANTIAMLVPVAKDATPLAIGVGGPIDRINLRRDDILRALRRHLNL